MTPEEREIALGLLSEITYMIESMTSKVIKETKDIKVVSKMLTEILANL